MIDGLTSHGMKVSYRPAITGDELAASISLYDVVVVRSRTKINANVLKNASRLRIIARAGIGTDNIDMKAAEKMKITVVTAAGSSTQSVAELNIALAVDLARRIPLLDRRTKSGTWLKDTGTELYGKTAGIIGFGRIGFATALILRAMGISVIAYDIARDHRRISEVSGKYVDIDELFRESDIIFVLATLSGDSSGMIGKKHFSQMKRGSLMINTSRSEFINGPDLLAALKEGKMGGYAADVAWNEPPSEAWEKELISLENVIITPHIGAQTVEAQRRVAMYTLDNLFKAMEEIQG